MVCLSSARSRCRRSGRSHSAVVVAFVLGIGAAMLGYLDFPDNVMLILGPVVLGSLVMTSCGIQIARTFVGFWATRGSRKS